MNELGKYWLGIEPSEVDCKIIHVFAASSLGEKQRSEKELGKIIMKGIGQDILRKTSERKRLFCRLYV